MTTPDPGDDAAASPESPGGLRDALVIAWSAFAPERVGEIAFLEPSPKRNVLGRGGEDADSARAPSNSTRLSFLQQRPGLEDPRGPLREPGVSREQLFLLADNGRISVECRGRCTLHVNGKYVEKEAQISPGDTLLLRGQVLLLYVRRPARLPPLRFYPRVTWPFGTPDPLGIVGESPAIWQLRDEAAFFAQGNRHALIAGESGTGKELAARTVHALSHRSARPFVSRNAATLPAGLIDAELFGNIRNYPNPGTPERAGVIGQADGSTLFLDEIGEMPLESQAHLLRVLDAGGEYQRLGDPTSRRSRFCLVAATNRSPSLLKHDILSRFSYRMTTPSLQARKEDIPLIICHLVRGIAARHAHVASYFDSTEDLSVARPRLALELVDALVRRSYSLHLRELEEHLVRAVMKSHGPILEYVDHDEPGASLADVPQFRVPGVSTGPSRAEAPAAPPTSAPGQPPAGAPTREEVLSALERAGWVIRRAYLDLGLQSRYRLYRLMSKHGIARSPESNDDE